MTTADVDRLYDAVESLRKEVHGYRADLNGRLRALEQAEAERKGVDSTREVSKRSMIGWASVMVAAASVCTTILLNFTSAV